MHALILLMQFSNEIWQAIRICFNKLILMAEIQVVAQPFLVMVVFILGHSLGSQELAELPHQISIYLSHRY